MSNTNVSQLYRTVIEDVINNVRESFLDDGVDEQILQELKQVWENKLQQTKVLPPENAQNEEHANSAFANQASHTTSTAKGQRGKATSTHYTPTTVATTIAQSISNIGATVVHPTLQYHYTTPQGGGDGTKTVTITLPQNVGTGPKPVTITLPAQLMQQSTGGIVMSTSAAAAAQALPPNVAASLLQAPLATINSAGVLTHPNSGATITYQPMTAEQLAKHGYTVTPVANAQAPNTTQASGIIQLDGANDTSDDDDDEDDYKDDDNDQDNDEELNEDENDGGGEEEVEPLNTDDDVSDEDPSELFDTDNVIVCQYDKITRSRNKWKFHLKDGIMNLQGRDFVFQKASGDAEW